MLTKHIIPILLAALCGCTSVTYIGQVGDLKLYSASSFRWGAPNLNALLSVNVKNGDTQIRKTGFGNPPLDSVGTAGVAIGAGEAIAGNNSNSDDVNVAGATVGSIVANGGQGGRGGAGNSSVTVKSSSDSRSNATSNAPVRGHAHEQWCGD